MDMFDDLLTSYLERTCDAEPALLQHIHRETYVKETRPHMLSGHYQGRLLAFLSKLVSPHRILEVGTFTGYATLCLAEGLAPGGEIHTIDSNIELEDRVRGYFALSEWNHAIRYHVGDAATIIPQLKGPFELVFIDADKKNNGLYYELALEKIPTGGLILIDNVLWKGKVVADAGDSQTQQIAALNKQLAADNRVDKLILPIRDGVYVLRKR
ncbi:O-methyltransferase [Parapedobacter indicus]|uniref:Predicted O-methyltransferase YrrM n=1 Tax=Parapedobacter indicus TaxID=1477437 RepID=A0A1I3KT50_9SPHI|nr:class I SAM-dependent methyltransferase [Parapedobacter indicus]PPL01917.1 putative O-methyltransferase YrrM [Parapedobacter indicus]SFI75673.1 Predicted O-methyltransferase YrrM [Parapedobacter indicus]